MHRINCCRSNKLSRAHKPHLHTYIDVSSMYTKNTEIQSNLSEVIIIKRASGASEAFCPVMKTNNCLRIRVLTMSACLHLAYASSSGVHVRTWRIYLHLDMSFNQPLPLLGMHTKYHAPTIPCSSPLKAWMVTVVWTKHHVSTIPCSSPLNAVLCRAFQRHFNKVHTRNSYFI